MNRLMFLSLWLLLAAGLTGCATVAYRSPVEPPPGLILTQVSAPLTVDFEQTKARPPKTGTAQTSYFYLPLYGFLTFAWDEASIEQAAKNGGIEHVHYADYTLFNVLGIFAQYRVHAYGD